MDRPERRQSESKDDALGQNSHPSLPQRFMLPTANKVAEPQIITRTSFYEGHMTRHLRPTRPSSHVLQPWHSEQSMSHLLCNLRQFLCTVHKLLVLHFNICWQKWMTITSLSQSLLNCFHRRPHLSSTSLLKNIDMPFYSLSPFPFCICCCFQMRIDRWMEW